MSIKIKAASVIAVICAALLLCSCGDAAAETNADTPEYTEPETEEAIPMREITSDYVIVVPAESQGDIKAANRLKTALSDSGIELRFIDDIWGQNKHEIILGTAASADGACF